jgi:hypothetical protein
MAKLFWVEPFARPAGRSRRVFEVALTVTQSAHARSATRSLTEVLVNRFSQGRCFVGSPRRPVQMHHQGPGLVHRQIPRPVDDEFLGSRVEIALTERRRIDRVEELSQLCDADLYDLAALRESLLQRLGDTWRPWPAHMRQDVFHDGVQWC